MKRIVFFLSILISYHFVNAQSTSELITHQELLKYKVDENRFVFGWLPNSYMKTPCFRDYTKDTGQMTLIDPKTGSVIYQSSQESNSRALKIIPTMITLDESTKEFEIKGKITGAWESVIPFEFKIYIGHKNDTISYTTISPSEYGSVYFNGEKVTKTIVVDTIPAFYLSNFKKFEAYRGEKNESIFKDNEILFDIKLEIDEDSVLIFGLSGTYAEIFEIGKLLNKQ